MSARPLVAAPTPEMTTPSSASEPGAPAEPVASETAKRRTSPTRARDRMATVYLGRQPILTAGGQLAGYELLHRSSGDSCRADFADGDQATREVAARTLLDFGLERLVGRHQAFVNTTTAFITSGQYQLLPAGQVVLEVLEDTTVDDDLLAGLKEAVSRGYRIALDDYVGPGDHDRLAALVSFVKIDVAGVEAGSLASVVRHVRRVAPRAILLAEKVETAGQFAATRRLDFGLYQGFYFSRPTLLAHRPVPVRASSLFQLMAALQRVDLTLEEIEEIIQREPVLTYRLLRLVNSGAVSLPRRVNSISQALVLLGTDMVRRLGTLLSLSTLGAGSEHLVEQSAVRAKMCQILAGARGDDMAAAFTTGLLSLLDVIMAAPMAELVTKMPLTTAVQDALTRRAGPIGEILAQAISYEEDNVGALSDANLLLESFDAFRSAIEWVSDLRPALAPRS